MAVKRTMKEIATFREEVLTEINVRFTKEGVLYQDPKDKNQNFFEKRNLIIKNVCVEFEADENKIRRVGRFDDVEDKLRLNH